MDRAVQTIEEVDAISERPDRDRLRKAQGGLVSAQLAQESAAAALERARDRMAALQAEKEAARVLEASEARERASRFEADSVCAVIATTGTRRLREVGDQIAALEQTAVILEAKAREAGAAVTEAESELRAAVQGVIDLEAKQLLAQMQAHEQAAKVLRLGLRALAYSHGVAPHGLVDRMASRPANYIDST